MFISQNQQRNCTRQIHDFIVGHIKEHYTIEELQSVLEISPKAMKRCFKECMVHLFMRISGLIVYNYWKIIYGGNLSVKGNLKQKSTYKSQ